MDTMEKLRILTDAAKYDVACTSSGVDRAGVKGGLGSAAACGICHSFASDGRCISLLKVLMSNVCAYDCAYCLNRRTNETMRATFRPREPDDQLLPPQLYRGAVPELGGRRVAGLHLRADAADAADPAR